MYKKIGIRFILLLALLIAFNYIYEIFFYKIDLLKHSDIIELVWDVPEDADIIYVGESSNTANREDDVDKRSISAFIADYFPGLVLSDITKEASHAGIYKILLENIPEDNDISTLIVTLNLRSFNAQWIYSKLETPLQKSMVLIKPQPPLYNRFLLSFKAYDIKSNAERQKQVFNKWETDVFDLPFPFELQNVRQWDKWMANTGIKDTNGKYDLPQTELACHYIKGYGFQIDTLSNPRIHDFNYIVELARKRGWNLVFNLMAENTQKADKLVGDTLLYMMNQNVNLLMSYYQNKGVTVINNLDAVDDDQYIDQHWTTEHYAEKGRKQIARNVAKGVKAFYPKEFVNIDYSGNNQISFFNDCDQDVVWGQMLTISDEQSYSGSYSSKTGKGELYSITLEYPLNLIPDSLKNKIVIDFKVFQESTNHNAKLAIQADGENIDYFWIGEHINSQIKTAGTWGSFHYVLQIPDNIKEADVIKIYILNESNTLVYIDDFSIVFE